MSRLTLENITKVYGEGDQQVTALRDASLFVEAGGLGAIVGPSGSGKTTLLAVAGALEQPTRGTLLSTASRWARCRRARWPTCAWRGSASSSSLVPFLRVRDRLQLVPT